VTEDRVALAHRNLMAVNARMAEAPGGGVWRDDSSLFVAPPSELPFLNTVMREPRETGGRELLAAAREFFFGMGRGFVVYCWPGDPDLGRAAEEAGMLEVLGRFPEMVCRGPLPEPRADLREVESVEDGEAYWGICDEAYVSLGLPAGVLPQAFAPETVLGSDSVAAWLAPAEGPPLACAALFVAEQVGMVSWVGALPEARGRGLARACTVRATNEAFARGAELASLQASVMGEGLYRRLGYEELYSYRLLGAMPD
jgi:ribosomal protein S18 acetylase RimI-like enzyme